MNKQLEDLMRRLEMRVGQLIEQREQLLKQVKQLQASLHEAQEDKELLQMQYDELSEQYAHLKMAKYIDMADSDVKDLRGRVRQMVRDIDRCIAMLKADDKA